MILNNWDEVGSSTDTCSIKAPSFFTNRKITTVHILKSEIISITFYIELLIFYHQSYNQELGYSTFFEPFSISKTLSLPFVEEEIFSVTNDWRRRTLNRKRNSLRRTIATKMKDFMFFSFEGCCFSSFFYFDTKE